MLVLEAGQICPYGNSCPYNNNNVRASICQGTLKSRNNKFTCEFVVNGQLIKDMGVRLPEDKTGKMKIIID